MLARCRKALLLHLSRLPDMGGRRGWRCPQFIAKTGRLRCKCLLVHDRLPVCIAVNARDRNRHAVKWARGPSIHACRPDARRIASPSQGADRLLSARTRAVRTCHAMPGTRAQIFRTQRPANLDRNRPLALPNTQGTPCGGPFRVFKRLNQKTLDSRLTGQASVESRGNEGRVRRVCSSGLLDAAICRKVPGKSVDGRETASGVPALAE
ncbi:hypothetical protein J2X52_000458 [Luteimonas sp. 3794]|nr:hypothetical protein [Luteimonas sp. 3794]